MTHAKTLSLFSLFVRARCGEGECCRRQAGWGAK